MDTNYLSWVNLLRLIRYCTSILLRLKKPRLLMKRARAREGQMGRPHPGHAAQGRPTRRRPAHLGSSPSKTRKQLRCRRPPACGLKALSAVYDIDELMNFSPNLWRTRPRFLARLLLLLLVLFYLSELLTHLLWDLNYLV